MHACMCVMIMMMNKCTNTKILTFYLVRTKKITSMLCVCVRACMRTYMRVCMSRCEHVWIGGLVVGCACVYMCVCV